jgi:hypothetical protein
LEEVNSLDQSNLSIDTDANKQMNVQPLVESMENNTLNT